MTQKAFATQERSNRAGAKLSIRLWGPGGASEPDAQVWRSTNPAALVILDLIQASDGAFAEIPGGILASEFRDLSSATAAALRIQWALQGVAESEGTAGIGASMLLQVSGEAILPAQDGGLSTQLADCAPGQILLTEETAHLLKDLPALPVSRMTMPADGGHPGPWELNWRSMQGKTNRAADEQSMAQIFQQRGVNDPAPESAIGSKEPTLPLWTPTVEIPLPGALQTGGGKVVEIPHTPEVIAHNKRSAHGSGWLATLQQNFRPKPPKGFVAAAVGVLILLVGTTIGLVHLLRPGIDGQEQETVKVVTPPKPQGPETTGNLVPAPTPTPVSTSPSSHPPRPQDGKGRGQDAQAGTTGESGQAPERPPDPKPGKGCTLTPGYYDSILATAEAEYQERHFDAAIRDFQSVLNCQPKNKTAIAGLDKSKKAQKGQ